MRASPVICPFCKRDLAARRTVELRPFHGPSEKLKSVPFLPQEGQAVICTDCHGPNQDELLVWRNGRLSRPKTRAEAVALVAQAMASGYGAAVIHDEEESQS